MSGVDSFLYQLWLVDVRVLAGDHAEVVQFFSGLLCALMPIGWYWCARHLLPHKWALACGILLAIFPSFITIYAYFVAETLLLVLMGFAAWQTAKGYHSRSWQQAACATIFWFLAALTRYAAIIPAVACSAILLFRLLTWKYRSYAIIVSLLVLGPMMFFSAWHSKQAINVYTVFGMPQLNAILARSQGSRIIIDSDMTKREQWFRSPSYYSRPLLPFSDWHMRTAGKPVHIRLKKEHGIEDWNREISKHPVTFDVLLRQVKNNIIFLFTGPSWPDSWPSNWSSPGQFLKWESDLNFHLRWLWVPIIFFVVMFGWRVKDNQLHQLFLLLTFCMLSAFILQTTAVFEGRYRKPLEPFLLMSVIIILYHTKSRREAI